MASSPSRQISSASFSGKSALSNLMGVDMAFFSLHNRVRLDFPHLPGSAFGITRHHKEINGVSAIKL
jgi:hypothetical protein